MSFIYRFKDRHQCEIPNALDIRAGDVWRCDDCDLIHVRMDDQYWEPAPRGSKLFTQTCERLEMLGVNTIPLRT